MSNSIFDHANFMAEVQVEGYQQLTWIAKEDGKGFNIAIGAV